MTATNHTLGSGTDVNAWRYLEERAELVERVIQSEARCRLLERALREYGQEPSYVNALLGRIVGLEATVEQLVHEREQKWKRKRKSA